MFDFLDSADRLAMLDDRPSIDAPLESLGAIDRIGGSPASRDLMPGDDRLAGDDRGNRILSGSGNDFVAGGAGDDWLFGNRNRDLLDGGIGRDRLHGGKDDDTIRGGEGDDTLLGEKGTDRLLGGAGIDRFAIGPGEGGQTADRADRAVDFELGVDRLLLRGGLTFEDLEISPGLGPNANDAIVRDRRTGEFLMVLAGADASRLGPTDFVSEIVPPVREASLQANRPTPEGDSAGQIPERGPAVSTDGLDPTLAGAIARAADLRNYTPEALATVRQWVVGLPATAKTAAPAALAASLGARSVSPAGPLPNAYLVEFEPGEGAESVAARLAEQAEVGFAYPLVPRQQATRSGNRGNSPAETRRDSPAETLRERATPSAESGDSPPETLCDRGAPRFLPDDPLFADQWHLANVGQSGGTVGADVNAPDAWDSATGAGVDIAIVDDGLQYAHPDLAGNYVAGLSYDFNGGDADPAPGAFNSHGTAVAGIAAGDGDNAIGISGAAPDASLAGLRLIAGPSSDLQEADALSYENQATEIYNNSWGPADGGWNLAGPGPLTLAALEDGVANGRDGLGSIYVWAAGNGGLGDNVNYDGYANSRYTIAVSAIDHNGQRSGYSEPGAPILVAAYSSGAGVGTTTTDLLGADGYNGLPDLDYTNAFGGTSSAAPLVSGIVALMLEANPALTWRDVQHILADTATQNDPSDSDWVTNGAGRLVHPAYGFGAVDAAAAVAAAQSWTPVGPELSATSGEVTVGMGIPDDAPTEVESSVTLTEDIQIESVEVVFDADHTYRGDLEVTLVSPDGTESQLAQVRNDSGDDYTQWTFTSLRHWGESSAGEWTLRVSDGFSFADAGTWNSWQLNVYGTGSDAAAGPDLVGSGFDATPDELTVGESFVADFAIANVGSEAAGGFWADIYLSADAEISNEPGSDDLLLGYQWIEGLDAGESINFSSETFALPDAETSIWSASDGTFYVGLIADALGDVAEGDETNNASTGWMVDFDDIQVDGLPDGGPNLINVGFDAVQEPLAPGQTFDAEFAVENVGDEDAGGFWTDFYLSADPDISNALGSGDLLLGYQWIDGLASGEATEILAESLTLPEATDPFWASVTDGTFYVGAIVNALDDVFEFEAEPDPEGWLINYDDLALAGEALEPGIDLSPASFAVLAETAEPGDTVTVEVDVENLGADPAGFFWTDFYLSADSEVSNAPGSDDLLLDFIGNPGLGGGASTGIASLSLTLPEESDPFWSAVTDGTFYLGAIADALGDVAETDETNNVGTAEVALVETTGTIAPDPAIDADEESREGAEAETPDPTDSLPVTETPSAEPSPSGDELDGGEPEDDPEAGGTADASDGEADSSDEVEIEIPLDGNGQSDLELWLTDSTIALASALGGGTVDPLTGLAVTPEPEGVLV